MENFKIDKSVIRPCKVILEPLTPKQQVGLTSELRKEIDIRNAFTTRTRKKLLSALEEVQEVNAEKDRKIHRERAIAEVLSSEISYLSQLELVKDYFMKPIDDKGILTLDEFQMLFGSIKTIYNVSSELLRELKKNSKNVAEAFSKIAPFFKLYSVYAYDYKRALNILQNAPSSNPELCKFLELQESRPEVQKKLSALLITPIQRVPRYKLLLKQILDYTSPRDPSYSSLVASLKKVELAAIHINSLVEEQENTQRLLELQRSLVNNFPVIIRPDRRLIREGVLMKMSQKNNQSQKRYFVLMSDILMYCKLKKENVNVPRSLKCSGILPLNKCKVTEILSKGAFTVTCKDEQLTVYHEHAENVKEWVSALNEAIRKCVNNKKTLRKDSSSRRPAHKKNIQEYEEVGVSPGQPRRKRKLDRDLEEVIFKTTGNGSEDGSSGIVPGFPLTKRKSIRELSKMPSKIRKLEQPKAKDILFPLRERHHINHQEENTLPTIPADDTNGEVFVFGTNNPQRGFRFTVANMFTGLGNSLKRMFGFGQ